MVSTWKSGIRSAVPLVPVRLARLAGFVALLAAAGFSQTPQASQPAAGAPAPVSPAIPAFTSVPPIEDVNLYYSFFNYHQNLINTNQALKTANPAQSAVLDQQTATLLQIDVKELPAMTTNTQQVTAAYTALIADQKAFVPGPPAAGKLTAAQMNSAAEFRRVRITVEGVRTLHDQLSPASWVGVHGYILGAYKNALLKQLVHSKP